MKHKLRLICVLLCIVFLFGACAKVSDTPPEATGSAVAQETLQPEASPSPTASQAAEQPDDGPSEIKWIASDIAGTITTDMDISPRDDFHATVNQDWLTAHESGGDSPFVEREKEVMAQIMELLTDETQTGHEAELVQKLYNDFLDMDTRTRGAWSL